MGILLTDEEIRLSLQSRPKITDMQSLVDNLQFVAKAQLKKFGEWGKESCPHKNGVMKLFNEPKRECPECWQALLKEME